MEISKHSQNHLMKTFATYDVAKDYAEPMFNYLVHGFHPGSFFTALLANDALRMIGSSHPANTIPELKKLVCWIQNHLLESSAFGSYENVEAWLNASPGERREELECLGLVFPEKIEIIKILNDEPTTSPILW